MKTDEVLKEVKEGIIDGTIWTANLYHDGTRNELKPIEHLLLRENAEFFKYLQEHEYFLFYQYKSKAIPLAFGKHLRFTTYNMLTKAEFERMMYEIA